MVGGLCRRTGKRTQSETSVEIHAHYVLCGTAWEQLRFEEDAAGLKGNVFGTWYFGQRLFFSPPLAMLEHATRGNNITVLLRFWAANTDRILEGGLHGWVHRTTTHHHHQLSGQLKKWLFQGVILYPTLEWLIESGWKPLHNELTTKLQISRRLCA